MRTPAGARHWPRGALVLLGLNTATLEKGENALARLGPFSKPTSGGRSALSGSWVPRVMALSVLQPSPPSAVSGAPVSGLHHALHFLWGRGAPATQGSPT